MNKQEIAKHFEETKELVTEMKEFLERRSQEIDLMAIGLKEKPHQQMLVDNAKQELERKRGEFSIISHLMEMLEKTKPF